MELSRYLPNWVERTRTVSGILRNSTRFTKSVTEKWITEDLTHQLQGGEVARPSWLGQPLKDRIAVLFKYWKDEAAEGRETKR